jgi:flagella basal body P-ring formation protein FlgA
MTSFASLALLAQLAAASPAPAIPAALAARVQAAVAEQWQLAPSAVQLAWGAVPTWRAQDTAAPLRLGPIGREGWLVVTLEPAGMAPRALRVRAGAAAPAPVAARALAVGTLLTSADIRWDSPVQWGTPEPTASPVDVDWEVRRALRAGEPLRGVAVAPPAGVIGGGPLRIVWARNGVEIEMEAVALTAARVGEKVQARTSTGRVMARMTAPGIARIEGGDR